MAGSNSLQMSFPPAILLLSLLLGLSTAMPWTGPEETKVYRAEDFSPRPTAQPGHTGLLVKRDSVPVNVCGWVGGRPESVARCGSGSSCIHETNFGVVGCCATAGPCTDGVYTTCIDSGDQGWESTAGLINNGILSCRASSTCFQNSFSGAYKQWSCGESYLGGTIQTKYEGQPDALRLQVVYTGIKFSPMSRPPIQTVPFTPEPTAGKAEPANTIAPDSADASGGKDETTGYIAGGTVGGIAVAAILIAGLVLFLRRRKRMGHKVGGLINFHHRPAPPPPPGPLKRLTKLYSPSEFGPIQRRTTAQEAAYMSPDPNAREETPYLDPITEHGGTTYISPLTGHPDESHQITQPQMREQHITIDRDLLMLNSPMSASTYNGGFPEMDTYDPIPPVPISRLNAQHNSSGPNSQSQSPQLLPSDDINTQQRQPLVGIQIDDFGSTSYPAHSRNWSGGAGEYANLNQQRQTDTHIHQGEMPEMTDIGLIGTMRRAASHMVKGNSRTQDLNARSESMRHSNPFSDDNAVDGTVWRSAPMNAPVLKEPEGFGLGLGFGSGNWGSLSSGEGSSNQGVVGNFTDQQRHTDKQKAERPLMEQMMEAFNAATRGVGGASPSISSASAASRHGGMYVVPEEGDGSISADSNFGSGEKERERQSINRVASNASLLRKPVGEGSKLGHRPSRSEI